MYRQARYNEPLLCDIDDNLSPRPFFAEAEKEASEYLPNNLLRSAPPLLPELDEARVVRHYTRLAQMTWGVDTGFYPLGSCTMKYNPRINETVANMPGFSSIHPLQDESTVQGALWAIHELQELLCRITGMHAYTLQPAAGAHGEFTGLLLIKAYHEHKGDSSRNEIIIPDTAHGTNPASAAMAGFDVVVIPSGEDGCVDLGALKKALSPKTAALMLTNPNTLGIFEREVLEIKKMVHSSGALLYYDGANLNAIMGKTTPGDMGFDVVHLNPHKTFSTPHGGGGPGAGPVGVKEFLKPFLPTPIVCKEGDQYKLCFDASKSIGPVRSFYGNFLVLVKALSYILSLGGEGLQEASEMAVINSNYLAHKIGKFLPIPYGTLWKHEFVASAAPLKERGCSARDLAKRLLDHGLHAPTMYFPLLVDEALMIEPTETESKETLDRFASVLSGIVGEPCDVLHAAPVNTSSGRIDEVEAVKRAVFTWQALHKNE